MLIQDCAGSADTRLLVIMNAQTAQWLNISQLITSRLWTFQFVLHPRFHLSAMMSPAFATPVGPPGVLWVVPTLAGAAGHSAVPSEAEALLGPNWRIRIVQIMKGLGHDLEILATHKMWDIQEIGAFMCLHYANVMPSLLQWLSPRLRSVRSLIETAVLKCGDALAYADASLQDDRRIVMLAIIRSGMALEFASKRLQNDAFVVMLACARCGMALKFASSRLRNDPEICLAAVCSSGLSLKFVSPDCENYRSIVEAAVDQCFWSLGLASAQVQGDYPYVERLLHEYVPADHRAAMRKRLLHSVD